MAAKKLIVENVNDQFLHFNIQHLNPYGKLLIEIKNLQLIVGKKVIGNEINFQLRENEICYVTGPNGCGKSTLFKTLLGFNKNYQGQFYLGSKKIGYVPQNFRESLLPWASVFDNIILPLKINGDELHDIETNLGNIFKKFNINIDLQQKVYELSGGQAQLVCVLRALIMEPDILLLDEADSALDVERKKVILELIEIFCRVVAVMWIRH